MVHIVLSRLRWDGCTQDYLRRRLAEGKTRREIIRCLKRYVAREIYQLVASKNTTASHPAAGSFMVLVFVLSAPP